MQANEKESINIKPRGGPRPGAGRPKGALNRATRDVRAAAANYTSEALRTLVEIMENGESDQARVSAAREVLDRAHGRPRQELDVTNTGITVIVDRSCRRESPVDVPAIEHQPPASGVEE